MLDRLANAAACGRPFAFGLYALPALCGQRTNLFLIGPMGSGKSAVGEYLAPCSGMPFYDSDAEIERRTGVDIPYIFDKEGEAGFRQREREAIEALTALPRSCSPPAAARSCCPRTGGVLASGAAWSTWNLGRAAGRPRQAGAYPAAACQRGYRPPSWNS